MTIAPMATDRDQIYRGERLVAIRDVLQGVTFGQRVAEDEEETLATYFVETEQWRKIFNGDIDIIYGPKGSGKSAIYNLLIGKQQELQGKNVFLVAGESLRGETVFQGLVNDPPTSENEFVGLWKLYILSLTAKTLVSHRIKTEPAIRLYADRKSVV